MIKARDIIRPADELALQLDEARIAYQRELLFFPKPPAGSGQKRRLWRFDFAFSGKVALEVDGGIWARKDARKCRVCGQMPTGRHSSGKGFASDCEKMNAAVLLGWRVFRATPQMVSSGEALRLVRRVV